MLCLEKQSNLPFPSLRYDAEPDKEDTLSTGGCGSSNAVACKGAA